MGELPVWKVDEVRENVPLQVVHLDHRNVARDREPLGERHAHEQRADQSGSPREGDGIQVVGRDAGVSLSAVSTTGMMFCWCAREASSGITPPYLTCTACEAMTFENSTLPRSTAAEVSSHEDSMPRIVISMRFFACYLNYFR